MNYSSIRELKQKQSDKFSDPVYIGAYGRFVKMNSGMSVEEALLLGEPTATSIEEENGVTTITQTVPGKKTMESEEKVDYTKVTQIVDNDLGTVITDTLSLGEEAIYIKRTVISEDEQTGQTLIEEEIVE